MSNHDLLCRSQGQPSPRVSWWRDHSLLDDSIDDVGSVGNVEKVVNELRLSQLSREDLHTILTCQATNNNISVPASTSVKLDMQCEFSRTTNALSNVGLPA